MLAYLGRYIAGRVSSDTDAWSEFSRREGLCYGGEDLQVIIRKPDHWLSDGQRWLAITLSKPADEVHICFGWSLETHGSRRFNHVELAKDAMRWIEGVANHTNPPILALFDLPQRTGTIYIGGEDSRITLHPRKSFSRTLTDKETLTAALAVMLAGGAGLLRTQDFSLASLSLQLSTVTALIVVYSAIKHWFLTPRLSWKVEGIES